MDTASNFMRTLPFVVVLMLFAFFMGDLNYSQHGLLLAVISGAITSGIGYTIWYVALRGLSTTQAAVSQLSVPVIAAFAGVLFMSEIISLRLLIAATMILCGTLLVILGKRYWSAV